MIPFLHITLIELIQQVGYIGMFLIILMETGLPFGFIFPGDSLLFTAGLLAQQHLLELTLVCLSVGMGAIIGDSIGYALGHKAGTALFTNDKSRIFTPKNVERTEAFYKKYGSRSLIIARFVPGVRTFIPIFAGVGRMPYRTFLIYNIVGGVLWSTMVPCAGFLLGKAFPQSEHYLTPIIVGILVVSTLPILFEFLRSKRKSSMPPVDSA